MIPSDHFVRFYNEVFKFLEKRDGLQDFYKEVSRHQEIHCLELFRKKGLQGMYDYWCHIRKEENCDMEITLYPDRLEKKMNRCPSLSKVLDNDAEACSRYCDHCPGWVIPLMEKAGYVSQHDLISRSKPCCRSTVYPASSGQKSYIRVSEDEKQKENRP